MFWEENRARPSAVKPSIFPCGPYQTARGCSLHPGLVCSYLLNIKVKLFLFFSKELLTTYHCGLENLNALEKICWQEAPQIVSACIEIAERFLINIFSCLMGKYQGKMEFWRYFWIILTFFFLTFPQPGPRGVEKE